MINGIFYSGQFSKGKKHGMGEETNVDGDGETIKGIWKNGVLLERIEDDD